MTPVGKINAIRYQLTKGMKNNVICIYDKNPNLTVEMICVPVFVMAA